MTFALKLTGGGSVAPFLVPTAAAGMLVAILLDAGVAFVLTAVLAVIAGTRHGGSLEFATYVLLGGFAGIVAVRRGDRLNVFVQAGIAIAVVGALVISVFSLLGARDLTGVLQLYGAALAAAAGAGGRGGRLVRRARQPVRDPHGVPAARARQPVAADPAPAPGRDAGHVPPLDHGRQPRRAGRRGDRRRPAADPRRGLLPRHRQARQPGRVHREPGRRGQHPRRARARGLGPDPQAARRRRDRPRLPRAPAQAAHRVHPAAPRDGDHELLLRPGAGSSRPPSTAASRRRTARPPRPRSTSGASGTPDRSRSRARPP